MPDPRTNPVSARVIFEGVMLMCINEQRQYETGMIQCPNHQPTITVVEATVGHNPEEHNIEWPEGHDLIIRVNNPENEGVTLFNAPGEDTDFSNVIDLEGRDFHVAGVTINTDLLQGRRLAVTAGLAYAHELSVDEFDLLTWAHPTDPGTFVKSLGYVADQIGVKIVCRDEPGSGIEIVDNTTGEVIESLSKRDTFYVISVNNDCSRPVDGPQPQPVPEPEGEAGELNTEAPIGTDFRFYYDLLQSNDGRKFDLGISSDTVDPGASPGACEGTFLSQTNTLGLHG